MVTSRTLAYQILLHLEQKASHPDRLIRTTFDRHSRLDERDRALLTELVYGVLRWQGRLDWHIDELSRTRPTRSPRKYGSFFGWPSTRSSFSTAFRTTRP